MCLDSIEDYATKCKGLAGTYLDTSLSEEKRLDHLVNAVAVNLTELTKQLVNNAPVSTNCPCLLAKPSDFDLAYTISMNVYLLHP